MNCCLVYLMQRSFCWIDLVSVLFLAKTCCILFCFLICIAQLVLPVAYNYIFGHVLGLIVGVVSFAEYNWLGWYLCFILIQLYSAVEQIHLFMILDCYGLQILLWCWNFKFFIFYFFLFFIFYLSMNLEFSSLQIVGVLSRYKNFNFVKLPSRGRIDRIEPLRLLLLKNRYSRWSKFPKFIGIEPEKLLLTRYKRVKFS